MDNSSSHVESRWRTQLRNRIIQASSLLEILLSGLVLIGLLLSAVPLIKWMPGLLIDGNEVELAKKSYTNTEDGCIRSNIFNSYVEDNALPGDARTADGALFVDGDNTQPSDINDGSYSAQIVDESAFNDGWTTVEVNFTVSGLE